MSRILGKYITIFRPQQGTGLSGSDRAKILAYAMINGNLKTGLLIYKNKVKLTKDQSTGLVANVKI